MDLLERLDALKATSQGEAHQVVDSAQMEIVQLRSVIDRAKAESVLIEVEGRQMVAVPYWFMKA